MEQDGTRRDLGTRVRLFASSYAPLLALLALRFEKPWLRVALGAAAAAFILDTLRIAVVLPKRVGASPFTIESVADEGAQVSGYLATYLLPFLAVPSPSVTDLIAYALFLLIAGVIAVRSDLTEINPTLYLLGYRLMSVTAVEGFVGYAIVRSELAPGSVLRANHLGSHVLVEVRQ
jgi:hypothetical protein